MCACYYLKNEQLLNNFRNVAKVYVEDLNFDAIKTAVIMTGMQNTYHRYSEEIDIEE